MRYKPEMRDVLLALQTAGRRYGAKLSAIRENDRSNALVSFDVLDTIMNVRGLDDCLSHMRQVLVSKFGDAVSVEKVGTQDNFMEQEYGQYLKRLWLRITENTLQPGYWREALNEGKKDDDENQTFKALIDAGSLIYTRKTSLRKVFIILLSTAQAFTMS
jgi:hypothetical protein